MSAADDRQLILRAQDGDLGAFGLLVQRHQPVVYNVAFRMFGNHADAEDMTQETFLRAFRAFDTFDAERPLIPWLRRIAMNVCLNILDKERVRPVIAVVDVKPPDKGRATMDDWAHDRPSPEQELLTDETAVQIRTAILRLPPKYRAVIELRHFQNLSYQEMSETLGRSMSNVKSDLFRARRMLAQFLQEDQINYDSHK